MGEVHRPKGTKGMTDEERKLMITMAKTLEQVGEAVKDLQKEPPKRRVAPDNMVREITDHFARTHGRSIPILREGGVVSTIEHEHKSRSFKMDVSFTGSEGLSEVERMRRCEAFLREAEELFDKHGIVRVDGTYVRIQ